MDTSNFKPLFCFLTLLSILATAAFSLPSTANENNSNLTTERKAALIHLLKQDCGSCHGMTLKGGLGPALLPENLKDKPSLLIKNTILFGRPSTAMPPWQGILTEEEVIWLTLQLQKGLDSTNDTVIANSKNNTTTGTATSTKALAKKDTLNEAH